MKQTKVYDLPTRLFHWTFAVLFLSSFVIAKYIDSESALYPYHMMMGLILALVVILRVLWGILGSRYARFSSFNLKPIELVHYFKSLFSSNSPHDLGHNAASSWTALVMMALAIGLAVTGFLMSRDAGIESLEDIHELFANAFILAVIAHVSGIALHTYRHRDEIWKSMIHGKKHAIEGTSGISKSYFIASFVFVIVVALFVFNLQKNYNSEERSLKFFGTTLNLGKVDD